MASSKREPRVIYVVARTESALYDRLRRNFSDVDAIGVVLDRRVGPRRRRSAPSAAERRRGDRRSRGPVDARVRLVGYAVVRTRAGERTLRSPA